MNAEQLHSVIRALHTAHAELRTQKRVNATRDALQNVVNNPGNAEPQQQYRSALNALFELLEHERISEFSIKDNVVLVETGLHELTGPALAERVKAAVDGDQFTPAVAVQELTKVSEFLSSELARVIQLDQTLSALSIGYDDVEPAEAQAGFYVPRPPDKNLTLKSLIEEQTELDAFVAAANEVVTGSRDSAPVKLLTASDYGFLLEVAPQVAGFMALAIERALAARKVWLETRLLKKQLESFGAPVDQLKGIDDFFEKDLDGKIRVAVEEAVTKFSGLAADKPRERELTNELHIHVKAIVNKADEGHYVDLKVGLPAPSSSEPEEGADSVVQSESLLRMREIDHLTRRLHQLEHEARKQSRIAPPRPD